MKKLCAFAFAGIAAACCGAEKISIKFETDKPDCIYRVGEKATFKVTALDANGANAASGTVYAVLDNFGDKRFVNRKVDLAKENPFTIEGSYDRPGFLRARVSSAEKWLKVKGNGAVWGVAVEPEKIKPGAECPKDFDEFWANAKKKLEETVPADVKLEKVEARSGGKTDYYEISAASWGGRRVWGWLSVPKGEGKKWPVRVSVPGAGIGAGGTWPAPDAITLTMNVHSYPQPEGKEERKAAYEKQDETYAKPCGVKRYCHAGIHKSREDYFYYASILGINRVVEWVWARPDVDRTDFTYSGTSQGGGFGFILTGLSGKFTKSCIFVPAITDLVGFRQDGRQSGWPRIVEAQKEENKAAAEKNAPYFDGLNFAARIKCPVRVVAGFADTVCSPAAVHAAYNLIPAKDKAIINGIGMGHGVFPQYYRELRKWERGE